jgi:hypothetical protein
MPSQSSNGGIARKKALSPAKRSDIARKAAQTRWDSSISEAVCGSPDKPLRIGDAEIECYVLDDETRVITQASFLEALGRHRRASTPREADQNLPPILQGKAIQPFISDEVAKAAQPVAFKLPGGARANGYRADLLAQVCEVYMAAAAAGALPKNQEHVAERASILMRGFARTGIVALVDEATGYQAMRKKDALAQILETYVAKEIQAYVKSFPQAYYQELFRLRGLDYTTDSVKRPQYFGHLTNDVIYKRLAPGVLDELKRIQRRDDGGRPKDKLFQRLTANVGYPKLREHLGSVVAIMSLSDDWVDFKSKLDRLHPRLDGDAMLPFEDEGADPDRGL